MCIFMYKNALLCTHFNLCIYKYISVYTYKTVPAAELLSVKRLVLHVHIIYTKIHFYNYIFICIWHNCIYMYIFIYIYIFTYIYTYIYKQNVGGFEDWDSPYHDYEVEGVSCMIREHLCRRSGNSVGSILADWFTSRVDVLVSPTPWVYI
jgi:hypothetical protein